jgi:hypothetical protein
VFGRRRTKNAAFAADDDGARAARPDIDADDGNTLLYAKCQVSGIRARETRAGTNVAPRKRAMDEQHPRGTLAIVAVFGVLFALGWLAMFLFVFLQRGAPHL